MSIDGVHVSLSVESNHLEAGSSQRKYFAYIVLVKMCSVCHLSVHYSSLKLLLASNHSPSVQGVRALFFYLPHIYLLFWSLYCFDVMIKLTLWATLKFAACPVVREKSL